MNKNVALVLQGGGTRAIYTSGVLDVFMEKGISFPYVIGTSAGALNACGYISGDKGRNKQITMVHMQRIRFASLTNYLTRGTFFDFKYLFHEIPKELPFNWDAFYSAQVRLFCACTSFKSGKPAYFEKSQEEFLDGVAASASLPAMIRKPVMVGGEPYCDGGVACAIPFRKPLEDGFKKIVIICTQPKGYRKDPDSEKLPLYMQRYVEKYPEFVEAFRKWHATYNADMDEVDRLGETGQAFVLYPSRPPRVSVATRSKKALNSLYDLGQKDAKTHFLELLDYLKEDF